MAVYDREMGVLWREPGDPDPDDGHRYDGDGTSDCAVCQYPMNAHDPDPT